MELLIQFLLGLAGTAVGVIIGVKVSLARLDERMKANNERLDKDEQAIEKVDKRIDIEITELKTDLKDDLLTCKEVSNKNSERLEGSLHSLTESMNQLAGTTTRLAENVLAHERRIAALENGGR